MSVKSDNLFGAIKDNIELTIARVSAIINSILKLLRLLNSLLIDPLKSLDFSKFLPPGLGIV